MIGKLRRAHVRRLRAPGRRARSSSPSATCRWTPTRWGCCSATGASPAAPRPASRPRTRSSPRRWKRRCRASSSCTRAVSTTCCGTSAGGRGGLRICEPRHGGAARARARRARDRRRSSSRRSTCTTAPQVRLAVLQGLARHRRWAGHAGRPDLPGPVHDLLGPAPRRRGLLVRSLGGVAYSRTGPLRAASPAGPKAVRCTHRPRRARRRHPAARGHRAVPARAEGTAYNATGGGRPMRFIDSIEPAGAAECVCIAVGGRGLAVRHRGLPRHAQHPQRRVHHPGRGAEHARPSR